LRQLSDGLRTDLGFEGCPTGSDVVVDLDPKRLQEPAESLRRQKVEIHSQLRQVFE
jgi:hypothetical protein